MGTFIIIMILLFAASIALYDWAEKTQKQEREKEKRKREESEAQISAFAEKYMSGWDYVPASLNGDAGFIAISNDGLQVRFATYSRWREGHPLLKELSFDISAIISSDVITPDEIKTITHQEKMPVSVQQRRSPVGRAVVGGILLGPIGAAAGAASGLNGKSKIEYHKVERKETIAVKGDAILVLGLKGVGIARLKIEFEQRRLASDWWYRIQSARG